MIEGFRSGRQKNTWIRIRNWIRFRNTGISEIKIIPAPSLVSSLFFTHLVNGGNIDRTLASAGRIIPAPSLVSSLPFPHLVNGGNIDGTITPASRIIPAPQSSQLPPLS